MFHVLFHVLFHVAITAYGFTNLMPRALPALACQRGGAMGTGTSRVHHCEDRKVGSSFGHEPCKCRIQRLQAFIGITITTKRLKKHMKLNMPNGMIIYIGELLQNVNRI